MLATRKALILSTVLQASAFAWADNAATQSSAKLATPRAEAHPSPKIDYLNLRVPLTHDDLDSHEAISHGGFSNGKSDIGALNVSPPVGTGLHLSTTDPRPSLIYKFSDKSTVHVHIGAHGANASTSWGF